MASPAYSLAQDPAYLAFLRASGLSQEIATADVARRQTALKAALGIQQDDLAGAGVRERRGIAGAQESRGVFRSGQTQNLTKEQEDQQARRNSALELAAATGIGDLQSGLESSLAAQQLRGSELALQLGQNAALASGEAALGVSPAATTTPYQFTPLGVADSTAPKAPTTTFTRPRYAAPRARAI